MKFSKNKIIFLLVALSVIVPFFAKAATLNFVASQNQFVIGDKFSVDVKVDSESAGINAVQATIQFPPDILVATSTDKTDSSFNFWLQDPTIDNNAGKITFIAGSTSGFSGKSLQVLRINFIVKGAGQANINFTDGAITASDGSGTNVLSSMQNLQITSITKQDAQLIPAPKIVKPAVPTGVIPSKPVIQVPLYPDQNSWYNSVSSFIVQWKLPSDVTGVAAVINKEPLTNPNQSDGVFDNKTFSGLSDGIWYLHVRFKNDVGWGPAIHYKISIDTIPPVPFTATIKEGNTTDVINPTVQFETTDQPSGIDFYQVVVDNSAPIKTTSTSVTLPPQNAGTHKIVVSAFDFAGNSSESRISVNIQEKPFFVIGGFSITQSMFFISIIILIFLGILAGWHISYLTKKRVQGKVIIAQRDVVNSFNLISKEIDILLSKYNDGKVDETEIQEIKFSLERLKATTEKIKKYVADNIEEIED